MSITFRQLENILGTATIKEWDMDREGILVAKADFSPFGSTEHLLDSKDAIYATLDKNETAATLAAKIKTMLSSVSYTDPTGRVLRAKSVRYGGADNVCKGFNLFFMCPENEQIAESKD